MVTTTLEAMDEGQFGARLRTSLHERGMSVRQAARVLKYDHSYLSRVMSGRQRPSEALVAAVAEHFPASVIRPAPSHPTPLEGPEYIRSTVAYFLDHDNRYGGSRVADAALQVWRAEQAKVDRAMDPGPGYLSAVAELAEVAGWISFDADRQADARQAFTASHVLARQAGDRPRDWFALDMLAMQDVHRERPGSAMRTADEMLDVPNLPPRVALLARVRLARALAQAGDRARSVEAVKRARGALQDSVTARDPAWAWWVTEAEVIGHQGEVLMSLGDHAAAVPFIRDARAATSGGRGGLYFTVSELTALAGAGAWRDAEALLVDLPSRLDTVSSARSRARLTSTLTTIRTHGPPWAASMAHDVAELV
ncbi:helix-turn-helix domain-containing protein [Streptomyces sp. NPDC091292]|uniref:helix-turn-helix domain-containing protein n=1 Tax=Streptomyces sp. NPDC091292 TaxID=3365991 RepID=UPI00382EA354